MIGYKYMNQQTLNKYVRDMSLFVFYYVGYNQTHYDNERKTRTNQFATVRKLFMIIELITFENRDVSM